MTKDLTVDLRAIRMMSGITIWIEAAKAKKIEDMLATPRSQWPALLKVGDELIAPSSIEGVFTPATMESDQRRKNGQWQCKSGTWHDRGETCDCRAEKARNARYRATDRVLAEANAGPKPNFDFSRFKVPVPQKKTNFDIANERIDEMARGSSL